MKDRFAVLEVSLNRNGLGDYLVFKMPAGEMSLTVHVQHF
jgi:hypothetical protein